ncbi:MAG: ferredoxin [bacterium]
MKVTIDRDECTMCALCWETCPDFFEESQEDGMSQIVAEYRDNGNVDQGEAPESLYDCVTEAAEECPVEIIHIEE